MSVETEDEKKERETIDNSITAVNKKPKKEKKICLPKVESDPTEDFIPVIKAPPGKKWQIKSKNKKSGKRKNSKKRKKTTKNPNPNQKKAKKVKKRND